MHAAALDDPVIGVYVLRSLVTESLMTLAEAFFCGSFSPSPVWLCVGDPVLSVILVFVVLDD